MKSTRVYARLAVVAVWAVASIAFAQKSTHDQVGPVPPAVIHAKSIFVSNAGSDCGLYPQLFTGDEQPSYLFTGDQDRPYTEFYAALKAKGDYQLVNDPSQADLVLELQLRAPHVPSGPNPVLNSLPEFRLVVFGTQSHFILWTITQSIEPAILQKNVDKNFDQALNAVLNEFLYVAGKGPAPQH